MTDFCFMSNHNLDGFRTNPLQTKAELNALFNLSTIHWSLSQNKLRYGNKPTTCLRNGRLFRFKLISTATSDGC